MQNPCFSVEIVDGCRLGKLVVPFSQMADWLNFLVASHYRAEMIGAAQHRDAVELYFQASEGLYLYLDMRLNQSLDLAIA